MNRIVIGAGFGDEGKGQTVSNLIEEHHTDMVIRFNGGQQAGHTVEYKGIRHVFSNFGAGTLQNIPTFFSEYCSINPITIYNEYRVLKNLGISPILYIHPLAQVTTPLDVFANMKDSNNMLHGTTGQGFGKTVERSKKHFNIFAEDLKVPSILKIKLKTLAEEYYKKEINSTDTNISYISFDTAVDWMLTCKDIQICIPKKWKSGVFEGAQGILLDQDFGFFPNVTYSKTTSYNALRILEKMGFMDSLIEIYNVSRCYHTRHGKGEFTSQLLCIPFEKDELKKDIVETNVYNKFQGDFKRSPLNLDWLHYSLNLHKAETGNNIVHRNVFTCFKHLCDERNISVIKNNVVHKTTKNKLINDFNAKVF